MRVEAIRIEDGFFIPMIDELKKIKQDKVLLDIKVIEPIYVEYHRDSNMSFESWTEDESHGISGELRRVEKELWIEI